MDSDQFNRIAKAIADPRRFALLQRIAREPEVACMCLVDESAVTPATISHHIKELAGAGLIAVRKQGKCGYFRYEARVMAEYQRELRTRLSASSGRAPRRSARASAITARKTVRKRPTGA